MSKPKMMMVTTATDGKDWRTMRWMRLGCVLGMLVACIGCQSQQRDDQPPIFTPTVMAGLHAGTALSGPLNQAVELDASDTLYPLHMTLSLANPAQLRDEPRWQQTVPMAAMATLITSTARRDPFVPAADITRGAYWLAANDSASSERRSPLAPESSQATAQTLLSSRATALVTVTPEQIPGQDSNDFAVQIELMHYQAALPAQPAADSEDEEPLPPTRSDKPASKDEHVRLALTLTQRAALRPWAARRAASTAQPAGATSATTIASTNGNINLSAAAADDDNGDASTRLVRETLLIDLPLPQGIKQGSDQTHLGTLLVPFRPLENDELVNLHALDGKADDTPWLVIHIELGSETDDAQILESGNAMLEQSREAAAAAAQSPATRYSSLRADLAKAISLLQEPAQRRQVLVYLASRTGAALTGDLALAGSDLLLELLAVRMGDELAMQPPVDAQGLGWQLDRASLGVLVQQDGQRVLRDVMGVLAMHLGLVSDRPAQLEQILKASGSRQSYETRMLAEHLILLEDEQPSVRVAAWRWLDARGQVPPGFEPLASARQRQQALERAAAARLEEPGAASPAMQGEPLEANQADSILDELDVDTPPNQTPATTTSPSTSPATQPQRIPQLPPATQPAPADQPSQQGAAS